MSGLELYYPETEGKQVAGDSGHLHPSGELGAFGERRIMDGFGGLKRYEVRTKRYRCERGHEFETSTNHYSSIYTCPKCRGGLATSHCIELELTTQLKRLEEKAP